MRLRVGKGRSDELQRRLTIWDRFQLDSPVGRFKNASEPAALRPRPSSRLLKKSSGTDSLTVAAW